MRVRRRTLGSGSCCRGHLLTTRSKAVFKNCTYVNMEDPIPRQVAQDDIKAFFKFYKPPMIIDEIHRVPELLSIIQVMADEMKENGRFILTGSHQPKFHAEIRNRLPDGQEF